MRVLVLYNPAARRYNPRLLDQIKEDSNRAGWSLSLFAPSCAKDATLQAQRALEEGIELVVAAGGDGTVNAIASALVGSSTLFGVLPLGTANVFARNLGLPTDNFAASLQALLTGTPHPVDIGSLNGRYFTAMAGIGLDAQVATDVNPWLKSHLGPLAFALQFPLTGLTYRRPVFRLTLGSGERLFEGPAWGLIATNFPAYSYRLPLAPRAQPGDGLLDFVLLKGRFLPHLLAQVARSFLANVPLSSLADTLAFQTDLLTVETHPASPGEADGELMGMSPFCFKVVKSGLTILAP